jgi:bisphosphoglycerate-dependent phosphoglycerate mutase
VSCVVCSIAGFAEQTQNSYAPSVTQYCYHLLLDLDGALTGLSKKMIRQLYGEAQFKRWRRSYDERPPPISSFSAACECVLSACA